MLFLSVFGYCQTKPSLNNQAKKIQNIWFDSIIGQRNLHIDQGEIYYEKYRTLNNNHHFLFDNKFIKGKLKYNNQIYDDVLMKYDIYQDNLILKISSETEIFPIILNKELTSFFEIRNKSFYNFNLGFYEVIYKTKNITLVKKYFSKKETIQKKFIYSNFTHEEELFILKNNKFFSVKTKKHFYKIFPNQKKIVDNFFKINKRKNKNISLSFILNLLKKLNGE